ncbi:Bug family tripartite tricarboxylate transporter substrate binding protein [Pseudorhodoferax sp.]|uniref:Bug family tripartite tricarboxylate transporter substrate binding protein n=1 Tax=Pseudorhodoferax sp. TaxID=1993553 RepID=UPI002DD66976|nr:tripartite tricarboxylate transporter substrate binding protein [Pseudorhodoferax sp.]
MHAKPPQPTPSRRRRWLAAAAASLACGVLAPALAQGGDADFPKRPLKIVVGYAPGGTTDILARLVAPGLSEVLGQPVIVENRPGAGGNVGAAAVAAAPADGYTLMMGTAGNMTVNPWIYDLKFDTVKDFAPISLIAAVPNLMVVNPAVPARTVPEFIAWAKTQPGKVFFASSGTGNTPHMTGELFNLRTGLSLVHVPYKGSGPALTDLIAGQGVQVSFDNMPSAIGHVRNGTLRALAVTGATRSAVLPDLPTLQEAGLKDFDVQGWFGLFAPARTPPAIVARIHQATLAVLARPATRKSLDELGAIVVGNDPAAFARQVEAETRVWGDVVKAAGIKLN